MKSSEYSEQDLESISHSRVGYRQSCKQPGEAKEKHDSSDADHETNSSGWFHSFLLPTQLSSGVFDEYVDHYNEDDEVEDNDKEYQGKKRSIECSDVIQETATVIIRKTDEYL